MRQILVGPIAGDDAETAECERRAVNANAHASIEVADSVFKM